jgi:glycosyltransferase involved in cell wall biosynthesis
MPRCSIIIPVFNGEQHVAEAVESALGQTYRDREIVVVNDGSTDKTTDAIRPYLGDIVYVEQAHRGPGAARNNGLQVSTGELIGLLDADDVWFPNRLGRLVAHLDEHPQLGLVTTIPRYSPGYFRANDQAFWITQYNFMNYMAVIRRELFSRHGVFDETLSTCEDWELWIRFLAAGERFGGLDEATAIHRLREGSLSSDWRSQYANQVAMLEGVITKGIDLPGLRARLELARGRVALINGDTRRARRHFRAAAMDPSASRALRLKALPFALSASASWWVGQRVRRRAWKSFLDRGRSTDQGDVVHL